MILTLDEKRRIASLETIPGYKLFVEKVIKSKRTDLLTAMKIARGREKLLDAAMQFRIWEEVIQLLTEVPKQFSDELQKEGDQIYGR